MRFVIYIRSLKPLQEVVWAAFQTKLDMCKCIWLLKPHMWILLLPKCKNNKRVRPCYRLYDILVRYDCANAVAEHRRRANCREWNWKKDADAQHTIIFINSIRQAYLSSADAARSPIAVFDLEMSWSLIKCSAFDFVDVNFVKFIYSAGIEDRIYIHFVKIYVAKCKWKS